jgi:beta-glucosidase-like glycosyl hydrolase/CubicO group peptidase (beta-lactamase class C family)
MKKYSVQFVSGILFFAILLFTNRLFAQNTPQSIRASHWADSVYQSLTPEQRIGQLIITRANNPHGPYDKNLDAYIKKYNLGGVSFLAGDPVKQALQTNHWNQLARTPLFVAMDAEWGLAMRLKGTVKYPCQMTLGATSGNDSLLYKMGKEIAWQCRRMGIQINFAPVVDVNSNPDNPVIGMRSFGENPEKVADKALFYMKGMEDNGLIACAKHFPGHGNTSKDSHKTLPTVSDSRQAIEKSALLPYRILIASHPAVSAVMVAHLNVPALEKKKNLPSSLSYRVVTHLLKKKLNFKGLIITDALDMKGVSLHYNDGDTALMAFLAGNDILLTPNNIPAAIAKIKKDVQKDKEAAKRLQESVKKILYYKYLSGAAQRKQIDTAHLLSDLNKPEYHRTANLLFGQSVTVVKNDSLLPLQDTVPATTAIVVVGDDHPTAFESTFQQYFPSKVYYLPRNASEMEYNFVIKQLHKFDRAILCIVNTNISASKHFGISTQEVRFVSKAAKQTKTILNIFASPYALNFFKNPDDFAAIVVSYQEVPQTLSASAEIIAGTRKSMGQLPVSTDRFAMGTGIFLPKIRLRYGTPQEVGANPVSLKRVDSIALAGILMKAYPGCQILAAKNGIIFYHKAFGYQTYADTVPEKMSYLYDLASLTKVLATTVALMKQQEDSVIDINKRLSDYLPMLRYSNKKDLRFKEILSHQAGLQDWIPFYMTTMNLHFSEKSIPTTNVLNWFQSELKNMKSGRIGPDTTIYHHQISELYTVRVAQHLYLQKDYHYHMMQQILNSPLGEKKYKYSGLGFYLFKAMTERLNELPFDQYLYKNIYHRMGLYRLVFTPRRYFPYTQTNPTEHDTIWRKQQVWGDVHDMGAAMLGGVSGNAGLFGDAHDVAALMQMLMDGGIYDGKRILSSEVINLFNHRYFAADSNRRGLGFDKPLLKYVDHKSNCKSASDRSFGHSGFTGTYTWADPENGLVYVFLSNRVFPDMNNPRLAHEDIRTNIHQLFYNAFLKKPVPLVNEDEK